MSNSTIEDSKKLDEHIQRMQNPLKGYGEYTTETSTKEVNSNNGPEPVQEYHFTEPTSNSSFGFPAQKVEVKSDIPNGKFSIKDSGKREQFEGGAVRDVQEGKPRYELIPVLALKRIANLYANGALKYDDDNWKNSMPFRRIYASLLRHAFAFGEGDTSEDHLAAICFNSMAIMHYQEMGRTDLDDMPKEGRQKNEEG